jgi:hypothetical protein
MKSRTIINTIIPNILVADPLIHFPLVFEKSNAVDMPTDTAIPLLFTAGICLLMAEAGKRNQQINLIVERNTGEE